MIDDYTKKMNQVERHSKAMKNLKKCKENEAVLKNKGYRYKRIDSKTVKLVKDANA